MKEGRLIRPDDGANRELVANVHPGDWENPEPAARYNLVVVGAGTAGLVAAAGAAGLGAKVALVEKGLMGGDCLNVGCVPSKTLIRSSRVMAELREASRFGVEGAAGRADFGKVMERVRRVRSGISAHDSALRFRELGVDVFLGEGRFSGMDTVEAAGRTLRFGKGLIATGARAARPEIPGLEDAGFVTNETVFELTELPRRLVVVGGGPIGCELAQAFARLGSRVTLVQRSQRLLPREDEDASRALAESFARDGIEVLTGSEVERVSRRESVKEVAVKSGGVTKTVAADEILVAAGRVPNVEGLGLEAAGVDYDGKGVKVDDRLRTTNRRIFAAGDVALADKFTHAADFSARLVLHNALFGGRRRLSSLTIPWTTYTDPEVARVGLSEGEARRRGMAVDVYRKEFREVDRAVAEGEDLGFVKILTARGTDRIVGAAIVHRHGGEMIGEVGVAMAGGLGLSGLSSVIHPYPTRAEALRSLGDAYNRTRLTPAVSRLFRWWLRFTR